MRQLLIIAAFGWACSASAQDSSRDRADLDDAAGRILFQPTSIYDGLTPAPPPAPLPAAQPSEPRRRGVRVVYPGPQGR